MSPGWGQSGFNGAKFGVDTLSALAAAMTALALGLFLSSHLSKSRLPAAKTKRAASSASDKVGVDVSPVQFWATSIGVAAITFLLVLAVTGLVVVAVVPAVVVATVPRAYFSRKRSRRVMAVQEAWPDGLRDLLSSVRSGASLPSALESLGTFGPAPLRDAFSSFGVYSRSLGVVPALEMIRADLADPTSDRVLEVMVLAHQRGGNVVPQILSDLAEATTRDVWTLEQVRGEGLEQKINSRVVFVLPWLVLIVMTMRSGAFREFYSTPVGVVIVVFCGLLSLLGIFLASRIGSQPDEPRVFTGGVR
jgi:tight adherence protein B